MKKLLLILAFFYFGLTSAQDFSSVISDYLDETRISFGLNPQDLQFEIESQSSSKSMNVFNVYVSQTVDNIPIFKTTSSIAIRNNQVLNAELAFENDVRSKINTINPTISPQTAILKACNEFGIPVSGQIELKERISNLEFLYEASGISLEDVPVKLVFQKDTKGQLKLAWSLSIYILDASHYYHARIDAQTGELLDWNDWVIQCDFSDREKIFVAHKSRSVLFGAEEQPYSFSEAGAHQYRVFPIPVESPNHGSDILVPDPSNSIASPFGWHDVNGTSGAEYTITRGNNVWAQEDRNANNGVGMSPDGGSQLNFDFPYVFDVPPVNMTEASTVNLFFWNNIMHDVWYQYGFDEESGNFQQNNYGNGALDGDFVFADSQDGFNLNNATFATPPDGTSPRMSMYLWDPDVPPGQPLTILNGTLAGSYQAIKAGFGPPLPETPLVAQMTLLLDDNSSDSTDDNDGCDPILNGPFINNSIVIMRRGFCEYATKVLNAQNEGAIAAIVVNNNSGPIFPMGPGANGNFITIPTIMISQADGEAIIANLESSGVINASLEDVGPYQLDGSVDNGIITHEYGHGISNRLTGGAATTDCLENDEQMGEGWSDWIGLMMTIEPGDTGDDGRGVGTYVLGQSPSGEGLRPKKYSTNSFINSLTYDATNDPEFLVPHGVGSVWGTMLWDLTWRLIDEYGYDSDIYNGDGGNNLAMQLVIDGMKLQVCSPGFVDARDAILEADELANGGANRCIIWNAFANRGLGLSADQGSSSDRFDQTEAFDVPSDCVLGIEDRSTNEFIIYPNPSKGNIYIRSFMPSEEVSIKIYDLNGRVVQTSTVLLDTEVFVDINGLNAGVYLINISNARSNQTSKLIIE